MICEACIGAMNARVAPLHAALTAQRAVPTIPDFSTFGSGGCRA